jgi:hypothetical protein
MTIINQREPQKVNDYPKSPKEWCFGMYDFSSGNIDIQKFLTLTLQIFHQYGLIPTKIDLSGENASKGSKTITFKAGLKRLEKYAYKGFDGMWMAANPHSNDGHDSVYLAVVNIDFIGTNRFAFSIDEGLINGEQEELDRIYLHYYDLLRPKYSFCTAIEFQKGPSWYIFGVEYGMSGKNTPKWSNEEGQQIANWDIQYSASDYKTGDFRDIYEFNYVGPEHLNLDIGNEQQLRDVIGKEPGWGSIKQLAEGVYSWHLTTEEAQVLRQKLAPTGRILALKKPGS